MKLQLPLLFVMSIVSYIHGQGFVNDWEQYYSTADSTSQFGSELDPSGNIFVVGSAVTTNGTHDQLFLKYSANGALQWSHKLDSGNGFDDFGKTVIAEPNGNSIWCGNTSVNNNLGHSSIYQLDANGQVLWSYSSTISYRPKSISLMSNGTVMCVGNTELNGYPQILVETINLNSGALISSNAYDYNGQPTHILDFDIDSLGNIYLGGYTLYGSLRSSYVSCINSLGNVLWQINDAPINTSQNAIRALCHRNSQIIAGVNFEELSLPGVAQFKMLKINATNGSIVQDSSFQFNRFESQELVDLKISQGGLIYGVLDGPNSTTLFSLDTSFQVRYIQKQYDENTRADHFCLFGEELVLLTHTKAGNLYYTLSYFDESGGEVWKKSSANDYINSTLRAACFSPSGEIVAVGYAEHNNQLEQVLTTKFTLRELLIPPDYFLDPTNESCAYFQNKGQITNENRILTDQASYIGIGGYPLPYFNDSSIMLVEYEYHQTDSVSTHSNSHRVDIRFITDFTNNASVVPVGILKHRQHFYTDYVVNEAVEGVTGFSRLIYPEVWQNIDVHCYNGISGNKISFVVKEGQDPSAIQLEFNGHHSLNISSQRLEVATSITGFSFDQPLAYQTDSSNSIIPLPWQPEYTVANNEISFSNIGPYDSSLPLIIQLENRIHAGGTKSANGNLEWSSYISTTSQALSPDDVDFEEIQDVAANDDKVYYLGHYETPYLPGGATSYTNVNHGNGDAMIIAFDHDNMRAIHSTFLGGSDRENPTAISANDQSFVVVGNTLSRTFFPTLDYTLGNPGTAYLQTQVSPQGNSEAGFLSRFSEAGLLQWSTYLDDFSENEYLMDVALTPTGEVFACGTVNHAANPAGGNWLSSNPIAGLSAQTGTNSTQGSGFILKFGNQCEKVFFTDVSGWTQVRALDTDTDGNLVFAAVSTDVYNNTYHFGHATFLHPDPTFTVSVGGQTQIPNGTAYVGYLSTTNEVRFKQPFASFGVRNNVPHDVKINDDGIIDVICSAKDGLTTRDFGNGGYYAPNANSTFEERDMYVMELSYPSLNSLGTPPTVSYSTYFGADLLEDITNGNPLLTNKFQIHRDPLDNVFLISSFLQGAQSTMPPVQAPLPAAQPSGYYFNNFAPTSTLSGMGHIAALDANKNLIWSSFWGGEQYDEINGSVVINDLLYIGGQTDNSNHWSMDTANLFVLQEFDDASTALSDYYNGLGYSTSFGARFSLADINISGDDIGVGIEDPTSPSISIYPNPVEGMLTIISNFSIRQITLYDTRGRLVETVQYASKTIILDLSDHSSGLYLIKIATNNETITKKIQKL
jgi:hypothetical protein